MKPYLKKCKVSKIFIIIWKALDIYFNKVSKNIYYNLESLGLDFTVSNTSGCTNLSNFSNLTQFALINRFSWQYLSVRASLPGLP
jgi:hypothetical protein